MTIFVEMHVALESDDDVVSDQMQQWMQTKNWTRQLAIRPSAILWAAVVVQAVNLVPVVKLFATSTLSWGNAQSLAAQRKQGG